MTRTIFLATAPLSGVYDFPGAVVMGAATPANPRGDQGKKERFSALRAVATVNFRATSRGAYTVKTAAISKRMEM